MSDAGLTPAVAAAVRELEKAFPDSTVDWRADSRGGAFVAMEGVPLNSEIFAQAVTWVGFRITFQYPYSDVYPHFTDAGLARSDGGSLGGGFGTASFQGQPAIQISRRSNRLNPEADTAALKLLKVVTWMKSQT